MTGAPENNKSTPGNYVQPPWERLIAYALGAGIIIFVCYLIIRDKPFSDPNNAQNLRILLSLACGLLGGLFVGFLNVGWDGSGMAIRAGGGFALAIVVFFGAPNVAPNLRTETIIELERFKTGDIHKAVERINVWITSEKLAEYQAASFDEKRELVKTWANDVNNSNSILAIYQYASDLDHQIKNGKIRPKDICDSVFDEISNALLFFEPYMKGLAPSYPQIYRGAWQIVSCHCYKNRNQARCPSHPSMCMAPPTCTS